MSLLSSQPSLFLTAAQYPLKINGMLVVTFGRPRGNHPTSHSIFPSITWAPIDGSRREAGLEILTTTVSTLASCGLSVSGVTTNHDLLEASEIPQGTSFHTLCTSRPQTISPLTLITCSSISIKVFMYTSHTSAHFPHVSTTMKEGNRNFRLELHVELRPMLLPSYFIASLDLLWSQRKRGKGGLISNRVLTVQGLRKSDPLNRSYSC